MVVVFLTGGNCGPLTCGPWEACKYPAVGTTTTTPKPPPEDKIVPIVPIMPVTRQRRSLPHPVCVPMNSEFLHYGGVLGSKIIEAMPPPPLFGTPDSDHFTLNLGTLFPSLTWFAGQNKKVRGTPLGRGYNLMLR